MNADRRAFLASGLMLVAVAASYAMTPRLRRADVIGPTNLETLFPSSFGKWTVDKVTPNLIVDPQTLATIARTYTQTLSRTYVDGTGQRMMLSVAYGAELSDTGVGLHYPEVCYPAQGFKVISQRRTRLETPNGILKSTLLETAYGTQRYEPVTYWTMIGAHAHYGGLERKLAEVSSGLAGERADGLLVRVSSVDKDSDRAFENQRVFIADLLKNMPPKDRLRISGLS